MSVESSSLNPPGTPLFRDHLETKVASWIRPWDSVVRPDAMIIGAPLSRTSISHSGASLTPAVIRELWSAATTYNIDHDVDLVDALTACDAGDCRVHVTDLARCRANIRDAVAHVAEASPESLLVVLGGDHSITAPAVEGFCAVRRGAVGIVQLDAHMDLRNLEDGGPSNGTPIRQLIENGTVAGRNVAQIGLHAFANARPYREFAREAGITQITAREVAHSPIESLVDRALTAACDGTERVYVTVDMDVLDQAFAPGAPAMVPAGMTTWQLMEAMMLLGRNSRVAAVDFVEVDATVDPRRATVRAAVYAMLTFLTGLAMREKKG